MSNSNLKAFLNSDIESSEQYFEISQNTIKELIRLQNVQEHQALRCIIEIGQTLSELTHYKKRIKSKSVDTLWSQFVKQIELSPATITKYIKIASNPVLTNEQYFERIPASVFSLYELTKIEPMALQLLIESGMINETTGRTAISSILRPEESNKASIPSIPIMILSIAKDDWELNYKSIEFNLIHFLCENNINYSFSAHVESLNQSEARRFKKINNYVFQRAKDYFNETIRRFVDEACRNKSLCPPSTSLKKKIELLKLEESEVTTTGCTNSNDISKRLISLGLIDRNEWSKLFQSWFSDGLEKFPTTSI